MSNITSQAISGTSQEEESEDQTNHRRNFKGLVVGLGYVSPKSHADLLLTLFFLYGANCHHR